LDLEQTIIIYLKARTCAFGQNFECIQKGKIAVTSMTFVIINVHKLFQSISSYFFVHGNGLNPSIQLCVRREETKKFLQRSGPPINRSNQVFNRQDAVDSVYDPNCYVCRNT
jgi:hypothetical protein